MKMWWKALFQSVSNTHTVTASHTQEALPAYIPLFVLYHPDKARESFDSSSTAERNRKGQKEALVLEEDCVEITL